MPNNFKAQKVVSSVISGTSIQDTTQSSGSFGQFLSSIDGRLIYTGLSGINLGTGINLYDSNNKVALTFKGLVSAGSVSITSNSTDIIISGSAGAGGSPNTASNIGVGLNVYSGTQETDYKFRTITGINNLKAFISGDQQTIIIDTNSDVTFNSVTSNQLTTNTNWTNTGTLTVGNLNDDAYITSSGGTFWIGNATTGITGKLNFFMIGDPSNSNMKFYLDRSGVHLNSCLFDSNNSSGVQGYVFTSTTSGYFWLPDVDSAGGGAVLSGGISGYITKWFSSSGVTTSNIYDNGSNIAIGANTFDVTNPEEFKIEAGVTTSVNALAAYGNINSYFQLNIRNSGGGTNSSSDIICTSNNGNETGYYVDLGINSNGWTNFSEVGGANDGYLYNLGNHFWIGNATNSPTGRIYFFAGGLSSTGNMRAYIDASGIHLNSCFFDTSNRSGVIGSTSVLASVPGVGYQWSTVSGLPAGPNFSVQFNNGGAGFSGAQNLSVDTSGYLQISPYQQANQPLRPSTGVSLFSIDNTRYMTSQMGQRGDIYSFQPFEGDKNIRRMTVKPGSAEIVPLGMRLATSGTLTSLTPNNTTFGQSLFNLSITSTANVTGGGGVWSSGLNTYYRSSQNPNLGNALFFRINMSPPSLPPGGLQRFFVGMVSSGSLVISKNNPSTFTGMVGFGVDSGDTTYQFIMNNGRGGVTQKINTNISMYTYAALSAGAPTGLMTVSIYLPPTGSGIAADLYLTNGINSTSYSYRAASDGNVPSSGVFLSPHAFWWHPTGVSVNSVAGFVNMYMETDY